MWHCWQALNNEVYTTNASNYWFIPKTQLHIPNISVLSCNDFMRTSFLLKPKNVNFMCQLSPFLGFIFGKWFYQKDVQKIKSVAEWPVSSDSRQLQRFANFCWQFIKDYSQVAALLMQLTSTLMTFKWTPEADSAFSELKYRFLSARILRHPNPVEHVNVELDASDTGVGAVLSSYKKIHAFAYFSHRLAIWKKLWCGEL